MAEIKSIEQVVKELDVYNIGEHEFDRSKGITVEHLAIKLLQQIAKGNGRKHIYVSDDEEGNGFHPAFYDIMDSPKDIRQMADSLDEGEENDIVLVG